SSLAAKELIAASTSGAGEAGRSIQPFTHSPKENVIYDGSSTPYDRSTSTAWTAARQYLRPVDMSSMQQKHSDLRRNCRENSRNCVFLSGRGLKLISQSPRP